MADRDRTPDASIRGDANPRDQIDLLAARSSLEDFTVQAKGGFGAGVGALSASGDGINMLSPGGDFENATLDPGWTISGGAGTFDTTQYVTGSQSYKVIPTVNSVDSLISSSRVAVVAGQVYNASVWARPVGAGTLSRTPDAIRITIYWQDDIGNGVGVDQVWDSITSIADSTWQQLEVSDMCPVGATQAYIIIYVKVLVVGTDYVNIDAASFTSASLLVGEFSTKSSQTSRVVVTGPGVQLQTNHPNATAGNASVAGAVRTTILNTPSDDQMLLRMQGFADPSGNGVTPAIEVATRSLSATYPTSMIDLKNAKLNARLGVYNMKTGANQIGTHVMTGVGAFEDCGSFTALALANLDTSVPTLVSVNAHAFGVITTGTVTETMRMQVMISFDNGGTWSGGYQNDTILSSPSLRQAISCGQAAAGTPTNHIVIKVQAQLDAGVAANYSLANINCVYTIMPGS